MGHRVNPNNIHEKLTKFLRRVIGERIISLDSKKERSFILKRGLWDPNFL